MGQRCAVQSPAASVHLAATGGDDEVPAPAAGLTSVPGSNYPSLPFSVLERFVCVLSSVVVMCVYLCF